jgi:AbrB family looped-hinge helix DNA binding protein
MASTKITRKGQITIPIEIRNELGLKEGDYLTVRNENGRIVAENSVDIARRLAGSLSKYARGIDDGLSMEEIIARDDAAIEQAIIEDYLETERQMRQESK